MDTRGVSSCRPFWYSFLHNENLDKSFPLVIKSTEQQPAYQPRGWIEQMETEFCHVLQQYFPAKKQCFSLTQEISISSGINKISAK